MNKILFTITILINLIFMMLTALLPILVFEVTGSAEKVGAVLTVFMASLLIIRLICIKKEIGPVKALVAGTSLFLMGFILVKFFNTEINAYYAGSVLFGFAIGLVPPAVLTMLTNNLEGSAINLRIYNSCIAVASATAPFMGEYIYKGFGGAIYNIWVAGALILFLVSVPLIRLRKKQAVSRLSNSGARVNGFQLGSILKNREYVSIFLVLLISSISYGAIVAYLPIHLNQVNFSIGLYYFIFWSAYVCAQFVVKRVLMLFSEKAKVILLLVGLSLGSILISFSSPLLLLVISASVYGFSYGSLYNIFYTKIALINEEQLKNNVYALIGLMAYAGVGLAPMFLAPFLSDIKTVFAFSTVYVAASIIIFLIFHKKERAYD